MAKRVAVVTGAAGDIGRAIARRLLADHDLVLLADRDLAAAERAAARTRAATAKSRLQTSEALPCVSSLSSSRR